MTYDEAMKEAKAGRKVRHSKMGRGFYVMIGFDGVARIMSPRDEQTGFKLDGVDRGAKDWEVVK